MNSQPAPQSSDRKPVVALVFGGRSSEHVVSCATAASVLRAIDRERFEVVPIGIARDGRWLLMADDPELGLDLLREAGVALPPSIFEAWFLSAAHDETAMQRIIDALPKAAEAAAQAQPVQG